MIPRAFTGQSSRVCAGAATAAALVFVTATSPALSAQTTDATLTGTVFDSTGASLPGAVVQVAGASETREVTTDATGFYRAAALVPGDYRVTVRLDGFQALTFDGVTLPINRTIELDATLELAARQESVVVRAQPTRLDTTTSSSTQVIDAATIAATPLNGRNYLDLVLLTPGVSVNTQAPSPFGMRDTRGSILGTRAGNTSFLIDGLQNNDDFRGGVLQDFTQDAIQEFEVIGSGYKAEFGGGSGGVVNVITKSGANRTQGSAFYFFRDNALDASNVEGAEAPELNRQNAGFTMGGPVTQDRSWYFTSFERIGERREAIFPAAIPAALRANEDFSIRPETTTWRLFGKYRYALSPTTQLHTDTSWTQAEAFNVLADTTSLPSASNDSRTRTFLGSAKLTTVSGTNLLLETSGGYRDQRFAQNEGLGQGASQAVFFLDTGGSFLFGPRYADQQRVDQHYLTARQTATLFLGDTHSAKAGIEYVGTRVNGQYSPFLQSAIITTEAGFAQFGSAAFQAPQGVGFLAPGDDRLRLRNHGLSLFIQDDWRLGSQVTLNLGARYDYDSKFGDTSNLAPRLGLAWTPAPQTVVRANWGLFFDRYRLGLAQRVPQLGGVDGRVVAELNYPRLVADALPIPVVPGPLGLLAFITGDPFILHNMFGIPPGAIVSRDTIQGLTGMSPDEFLLALNGFLQGLPIPFTPVDFSPYTGYLRQDASWALQDTVTVASPFRTPFNNTMSLGIEHEVTTGLTAGLTYTHRQIRNVLGVRLTNLAYESRELGGAVTTDGGPLQRTYGPWYDGDYDALVFSVDKRDNGRYQLLASYTYARGEDNLLNPNLGIGIVAQGGGAVPTDNLDLEFDRGPSDLVTPHVFVASGLLTLPADVHLSGVLRATSGLHFSAAGLPVDYDGDGLASVRPVGTRRNQFRGPSSTNLDLRVEKRFSLGTRGRAAFLVEFFNLTNARNPLLVDNSFVAGAPGATFGDVRVPMPGREMQIGLRYNF